jgi:hypothetical protein
MQSDNVQVIQTMLDGGFTAMATIFNDCRLLATGLGRLSLSSEIKKLMRLLTRHSLVDYIDFY